MRRIALLLVPLLATAGCSEPTTAPPLEPPVAQKRPVKPPPEPTTPMTPVIAYEAGGPGARALWVADENGDGDVELLTRPTFFSPSWFPGGEGTPDDPYRILLSPTTTNIIGMELVEFVTTGGTPEVTATHVLSDDLRYISGRVSPDGASMVAVSVGDPPEQYETLVITSSTTFDPATLYGPSLDAFLLGTPAWSPDGAHLAFVEVARADVTQVTIMILSMTTREFWPAFDMVCELGGPRGLTWSPVADELAFACDGELLVLQLDGSLVADGLPVSLGSGSQPAFSADGTQLLYVNRDRIYSRDLVAGGRDARLGNGRRPDWRR